MSISLPNGLISDVKSQYAYGPVYLAIIPARGIQAIDMAQRYAKNSVPSPPTNCIADVEGRQRRVTIHCVKVSTGLSHDPYVRTSAKQEIEAYV